MSKFSYTVVHNSMALTNDNEYGLKSGMRTSSGILTGINLAGEVGFK